MRKLVMLGLSVGVLFSAEMAQASQFQLPAQSDFATVAPVPNSAVRQMPKVLPHDLTFHAPHDFYPRMRYRGRYYPRSIYVYQPQRYHHPRYGNRYWYRY